MIVSTAEYNPYVAIHLPSVLARKRHTKHGRLYLIMAVVSTGYLYKCAAMAVGYRCRFDHDAKSAILLRTLRLVFRGTFLAHQSS